MEYLCIYAGELMYFKNFRNTRVNRTEEKSNRTKNQKIKNAQTIQGLSNK